MSILEMGMAVVMAFVCVMIIAILYPVVNTLTLPTGSQTVFAAFPTISIALMLVMLVVAGFSLHRG
jgi:hypothetical protein